MPPRSRCARCICSLIGQYRTDPKKALFAKPKVRLPATSLVPTVAIKCGSGTEGSSQLVAWRSCENLSNYWVSQLILILRFTIVTTHGVAKYITRATIGSSGLIYKRGTRSLFGNLSRVFAWRWARCKSFLSTSGVLLQFAALCKRCPDVFPP